MLRAHQADESAHRCEWCAALDAGEVPETHRLQARLAAEGFQGVICPSFMSRDGACLALWRWSEAGRRG